MTKRKIISVNSSAFVQESIENNRRPPRSGTTTAIIFLAIDFAAKLVSSSDKIEQFVSKSLSIEELDSMRTSIPDKTRERRGICQQIRSVQDNHETGRARLHQENQNTGWQGHFGKLVEINACSSR
ncbi:MAG: hypothetical protein ACYCPP_06515, partial [Nitrososphaerales archaeon]